MLNRDRFFWAMHAGFFLLLAASASNLVARHSLTTRTMVSLVACGILALVYASGVIYWERARLPWLTAVVVCWLVVVVLAPSFSPCAIPLFFVCLGLLPVRRTIAVVALLTLAVIVAQLRLADQLDPSLVLTPIAVAAMTTVIFVELERENAARQRLIDDLIRTRNTLGDEQRTIGVLQERERLAREIHDTLAQGLSSMRMLLQAADRSWGDDRSRELVRQAAETAGANLMEARRFVRDLSPSSLERGSLSAALRELCAKESARLQLVGTERELPAPVENALLRIVQSALANVREHANATVCVVTLSYLPDTVTADIYDDGVGFQPAAPRPGRDRGFGLPAMRERAAELGGTLVVESAPHGGTTVAASIPVRKL